MATWAVQTVLFPWKLLYSNKRSIILFTAFESQRGKKWFDRDTFRGLMRLRGMESNSPSGYAEGFHARKVIFQPVA